MAHPVPKKCNHMGCSNYIRHGRYCPDHSRAAWQSSNRNPNHSATQRGYGAEWRAARGRVLAASGGRCAICGEPGANEVDHITPRHLGGTDDPKNLRAVHSVCHRSKSSSEGGQAARR